MSRFFDRDIFLISLFPPIPGNARNSQYTVYINFSFSMTCTKWYPDASVVYNISQDRCKWAYFSFECVSSCHMVGPVILRISIGLIRTKLLFHVPKIAIPFHSSEHQCVYLNIWHELSRSVLLYS